MTDKITFILDGTKIQASADESIWHVAELERIEIPHLCWLPEFKFCAAKVETSQCVVAAE
ncbi:MAG: 2Fe-2S iron-sulfur cluster-binding protein [Pseudomonadota bacterium]